ncbi:MAG: hypothetical protein WBL62_01360 [Gallionella sp.]
MRTTFLIGIGLAIFSLSAVSATMCNISGVNEHGVEYILAMEGVGATHDDKSDYIPDALLLKDKAGEVKTFSAEHCSVRFFFNLGPTESKSYIRCSQAGLHLRDVYYQRTKNPKRVLFVCAEGCNTEMPRVFEIEDCNADYS